MNISHFCIDRPIFASVISIVITLGGFGSIVGSLAGGLLLGVVEALGMHFSSPSLKMLLSYGVFIGVLLWRPNGLFARKR